MRRMTEIVIDPDDRLARRHSRRDSGESRGAAEPRLKARRKVARPRLHLTPLQRLAAAGVAVVALVVGGMAVWYSGAPQRLGREATEQVLALTARAGFRIDEITVTGRGRTPTEQIVAALGARHGDPILGVNLGMAKDRLEAIPSVRTAAVERRLPGAIHLALVEREPVAVWQSDGRFVLVDRDGRQIPGGIDGFETLPLVVGDGAPGRADELLTMLSSEPAMAGRVKAAVRVGNRRWNLMLDHAERGIEVRLPENDPESAWHRLAELERDRALTGRNVAMIDLRIPDRLVLKPDRTPVADRRRDDGV